MLRCALKASGRPLLAQPDEALLQDAAPSQSLMKVLCDCSKSGYADIAYIWSASSKVCMTGA